MLVLANARGFRETKNKEKYGALVVHGDRINNQYSIFMLMVNSISGY